MWMAIRRMWRRIDAAVGVALVVFVLSAAVAYATEKHWYYNNSKTPPGEGCNCGATANNEKIWEWSNGTACMHYHITYPPAWTNKICTYSPNEAETFYPNYSANGYPGVWNSASNTDWVQGQQWY